MAAFGGTDAVASLAMGRLSDVLGRGPVLVIGFLSHAVILVLIFVYGPPIQGTTDGFWGWGGGWGALVVIAAVWGVGDAVWQTQVNAMTGATFGNSDTTRAFAAMKLWQSVALAATFVYNQLLGTVVKLVLIAGGLAVGYATAHMSLRASAKSA